MWFSNSKYQPKSARPRFLVPISNRCQSGCQSASGPRRPTAHLIPGSCWLRSNLGYGPWPPSTCSMCVGDVCEPHISAIGFGPFFCGTLRSWVFSTLSVGGGFSLAVECCAPCILHQHSTQVPLILQHANRFFHRQSLSHRSTLPCHPIEELFCVLKKHTM